MNYDDSTLDNIQVKSNTLRNDSHIDPDARLYLWKETVHVRWKATRNQSTSEILEKFPGYTDSILVSRLLFVFYLN